MFPYFLSFSCRHYIDIYNVNALYRQDQNQINQHDEGYMALRAQAKAAGDKMGKCFDQSHQAYSSGDGARAKELSEEANAHKREMERLNAQASQWIFVGASCKPGEVDLHGLYVKEAIAYTDQAIQAAQQRGDTEVHLIVGKGIHSAGHVAKIKPAIEELMQKHQLLAELDPHNSGVLIVYLNGGRGRDTSRGINPDEISRRLEKPGDDCVVM
ncbi:DUF1771-domain-containing protein [Rickenella mellea]|uniref:DUF1771-domain-containing protein n=1 Tax=Rickenella mellea TaxID=50990 RepID=A0A4Y7QGB5_9AGAM|nr:DUF1771-domain-containing protein [Rickenella mellea]